MSKRKTLFLVREPNGRHSRALKDDLKPCDPAQVRRLRDAALRKMQAEEWGWEIGRLYLAGKIGAAEFEAGKRWRRLVETYRKARGIPAADPPAVTIFLGTRSAPVDPDSDAGRREAARDRAIISEMAEAHAVLLVYGQHTEAAVRSVCERDEVMSPEDAQIAARGLQALAELWCLTPKAANVRTSA